MTREKLKNWEISEYNENTENQLDYYINERKCEAGDLAYLYSHETNEWTEMEIVRTTRRSDNPGHYDDLPEDVLLNGESEYNADTSAEFITDNDCYLVWFRYINKKRG